MWSKVKEFVIIGCNDNIVQCVRLLYIFSNIWSLKIFSYVKKENYLGDKYFGFVYRFHSCSNNRKTNDTITWLPYMWFKRDCLQNLLWKCYFHMLKRTVYFFFFFKRNYRYLCINFIICTDDGQLFIPQRAKIDNQIIWTGQNAHNF